MSPPINTHSPEQRMDALALANRVRIANADTLRTLSDLPCVDGLDNLAAILRDGDEKGPVGSIPILRLLKAPAGLGETKAVTLLREAHILTGDRKLRQLTKRQRTVLADCLDDPTRLWPTSGIPKLRRDRDRRAA